MFGLSRRRRIRESAKSYLEMYETLRKISEMGRSRDVFERVRYRDVVSGEVARKSGGQIIIDDMTPDAVVDRAYKVILDEYEEGVGNLRRRRIV